MKRMIHYTKIILARRPDGSLYNARGETGDTTDLQKQLLENGQRSPIIVSKPNFEGEVRITQGHRRERAITALRNLTKKGWSEAVRKNDSEGIEIYKAEFDRWSYLWCETNGIDFADVRNLLIDMDAGTVQKDINPVSLGYAIRQRIEMDGFTLAECAESFQFSLDDCQAMINLTSGRTAKSVLDAVRSGTMTLGTYKRKFQRMGELTQERVLRAAQEAVEGNPRSHGVISQGTVTNAIKSLAPKQEAMFPDVEVVPNMANAYRAIEAAFAIREEWSLQTEEMVEYWQEKILSLIDVQNRELKRAA